MENRKLFSDIIRALSLALDFDENQKYNHAWRVAILSHRIASYMKLPDRDLIYYAGLLHDIGAIGLRDHVIHHAAAGFDDEDARRHSARGVKIIHPFSLFRPLEPFIADHHERFDGKGFPAQKKHNEIPVQSSIILMADMLDVSLREMEPERRLERGRDLIKRLGGTACFPEVAEATADLFAENPQMLESVFVDDHLQRLVSEFSPDFPGIETMSSIEMLIQILWVFAGIIDAKHAHTMGHSIRVAFYSHRIAKSLGEDMVNSWDMLWAGLLHDVGKVGTPRAILDKNGPLNEKEWLIMRRHASDSNEIISTISDLKYLAYPAASHHERYSGGGYPLGRSGEEIPLIGRIMAYSDAYDALTSERSFRDKLTHKRTIEIIKRTIGIGLDPMLAAEALDVFDEYSEKPLGQELTFEQFQDYFENISSETQGRSVVDGDDSSADLTSKKILLQDIEQWEVVSADSEFKIIEGGQKLAATVGSGDYDKLTDYFNENGKQLLNELNAGLNPGKIASRYLFTPSGLPLEVIINNRGEYRDVFYRSAEHRINPLKRMSLFYRSFLTTSEAVFFTDAQGVIIDVNKTFVDIYEYEIDEITGRDPQSLFDDDSDLDWGFILTEMRKGQTRSWSGEINTRAKTGRLLPIILTITAIRDANGVLIGYVGSAVNMTERKKAEQRIGAINKALLGLGVDHNKNVDRIIATAGEVLEGGAATFDRITDGGIKIISAWRLSEAVVEKASRIHSDIRVISRAIETSAENYVIERNLQAGEFCANDPIISEHKFQTYVGRVVLLGGEPVGVISVYFDEHRNLSVEELDFIGTLAGALGAEEERFEAVEKLRRRDEELEQKNLELMKLNQLKSDLVAITSHDLKSPLNSMIGYADLLREDYENTPKEKVRRYLENIVSSGYQLVDFINEILDLEKIESGKFELNPSKAILAEILKASVLVNTATAERSGIDLKINLDGSMRPIVLDITKIEQVFNNLISNAIKFSPEGTTIDVNYEDEEGRALVVEICDRGPGIPESDLESIFDRYYQVATKGGKSKRGFGAGLGLFIVKNIVELHSGEVSVHNRPEGGCCFRVRLPINRDVSSVSDLGVMLIDFTGLMRPYLEPPLKGRQLFVSIADTLARAKRIYQYERPELIFVHQRSMSDAVVSFLGSIANDPKGEVKIVGIFSAEPSDEEQQLFSSILIEPLLDVEIFEVLGKIEKDIKYKGGV